VAPRLALAAAYFATSGMASVQRRIDSHLHLWTPDLERYPATTPPPEHLNKDGRATHENFVQLMDSAGVEQAVAVQPVNYGQDYSYLIAAMDAHPSRLRGMFVADPVAESAESAASRLEGVARSHSGWVGVRFNPLKWPEGSDKGMADGIGHAMFKKAGELGLVVGFMAFKGLSRHIAEVEALVQAAPETQVIIDHWGFFLQPATGAGERHLDEESWASVLRLASHPQVFIKLSALFRVASDPWPFVSLSDRLAQLLGKFGSERLLWGSDFPFATDFSDYGAATLSLERWPIWEGLSEAQRNDIFFGTANRLFKLGVSEFAGKATPTAEL